MNSSAVIARALRVRRALTVMAIGVCVGAAGIAAAAPQFAAPGVQSSATTPVIGTLRVTMALFLVLAAVLAAAWLTRRLRGGVGGSAGGLQVLAQVPLGARERAVLLRVGRQQILVGVAPGNVRTLHVLDAADESGSEALPAESAGSPARPTFKSMLLKSLGK
jgi:flagellar protein FliO/FliZ